MSLKHTTKAVSDEEVHLVREEDGYPNRDVAVFCGPWAKGEASHMAWLQNMFDAAFLKAFEERAEGPRPTRWQVTIDVRPA